MSPNRPNSNARVTVLIVEDQTAIREMLVTFVRAMPGFSVVGEAGDVHEALRVAQETKPRVVVLDWMLLGGLGLDFLRAVRVDPPPYVLIFSANTTDLAVRESLAAGAKGYLEKTASFSEFTSALQAVGQGQTYLGPAIALNVRRKARRMEEPDLSIELTRRERDVLRFVAEGLSSKQIAEQLTLSVRTIENHRARIAKRTGLRSVAQLTLHAVRLGLVDRPAVEPTDAAPIL